MDDNITTREKILNISEELILTKGYTNFSYNDISQIINIRKASIHYHYPKKEDLGVAFIDRYLKNFKNWREENEKNSTAKRIENLFALYIKLSNNCTRICPFDMLSTEYSNLPDSIRQKIKQFYDDFETNLIKILDNGKEEKVINQKIDSKTMANIIIYSLSYSLKLAKMNNSLEHIKLIINGIKKIIF